MEQPEIYALIYKKKNSCNTFIRVCLLITTICTDLFRIVLGYYIKPERLKRKLREKEADLKPNLNNEQKKLLYNSNNMLTPSDLDLAVMFQILRFVCKIPPPAEGWGKLPLRSDTSIGACLNIIRLKRNHYFHKPEAPTDDKEFQTTWKYMRSAVVELERHFIGGNLFEIAVDNLYTLDVSKVQDALKQHKDKRVESIFFNVVGFANLLEEIAETIPYEKLNDMKEWIKNLDNDDNFMEIDDATTPKVCLHILRKKKLLQPTDVLCLQFILKKIGCETQFRKCVEYAQKNNALCYHETLQANGSRLVHVHVRGNLTDYDQRDVEEIKNTFVGILQCAKEEVQVGGICPSTSFFLMLSIRTAHLMKLLKMEQQDKDNLSKLSIDFIIVDLNVVFLGPLKDLGTKWNIYYEPKTKLRWKEGHTNDQPLEPKITELLSQTLTSTQKDIERKLDDDLSSDMKNTGSSSTSNKYQNKSTENFHRLCQLFVTICGELFREVIRLRIDDLRLKLNEYKKILNSSCNASQMKILYPNSEDKQTDLKDMDVSLLYILVRNICGIPAPKNGWGDDQENADLSIGACIDRIRVKMNVLFAHAYTGSIDTDSFEHNWGYLKKNIVEIAKECNSVETYKEKIDELCDCTLNSFVTKDCLEIIKKMEEEMKMDLGIKKEAIKDLQEDSLHLHHLQIHAVKRGGKRKRTGRSAERQPKGGKRTRTGRSAERQPKDIFTEDSFITTTSVDPISTVDFSFLSHISHIAYVKSGHLWVSGSSTLLQISLNGNKIETVDDALCWSGSFAVRKDGVLFYIDKNQRYIKENNTDTLIDLLKTRDELICCIYVSKRNNSLLLVIKDTEKRKCRVIRYDMEQQSEEILIDGEQRLIEDPSYITENSNGDVVVSDESKKTVVVVNSLGQHRFNIKKLRIGSHFSPHGICTDDNGRIFVLDTYPPNYIYIFDQDGNLSQQLHTKNHSGSGMCLDDEGNMFVGNQDGTIDVYRV